MQEKRTSNAEQRGIGLDVALGLAAQCSSAAHERGIADAGAAVEHRNASSNPTMNSLVLACMPPRPRNRRLSGLPHLLCLNRNHWSSKPAVAEAGVRWWARKTS